MNDTTTSLPSADSGDSAESGPSKGEVDPKTLAELIVIIFLGAAGAIALFALCMEWRRRRRKSSMKAGGEIEMEHRPRVWPGTSSGRISSTRARPRGQWMDEENQK